MSAEPRHGPVTMHRAVERALMKTLRARPADAPRAVASAPVASDAEAPADPDRPGAGREGPPRGQRGGRPRVRRVGGAAR